MQPAIKSNEEFALLSTTLDTGKCLDGTEFELRSLHTQLESLNARSNHFSLARSAQQLEIFQSILHDLPPAKLTFSIQDSLRWRMAWQALQRSHSAHIRNVNLRLGLGDRKISPDSFLTDRCKDWPDTENIRPTTAMGFIITTFLYGSLHLLAWNAYFRSAEEKYLWRISSCIVTGGFLIAFLIERFVTWTERIFNKSKWFARYGRIILLPFFLVFFSLLILYMPARAHLVVECFINLSHLPAGAYRVPDWSAYFPHIS